MGAGAAPTATTVAAPAAVDVTAILEDLAAKHSQKLDWRHSIVDLMKLVGMDSSLAARKELAAELHYTGDTADSAKMNIWLHKQVLQEARRERRQGASGSAQLATSFAAREPRLPRARQPADPGQPG